MFYGIFCSLQSKRPNELESRLRCHNIISILLLFLTSQGASRIFLIFLLLITVTSILFCKTSKSFIWYLLFCCKRTTSACPAVRRHAHISQKSISKAVYLSSWRHLSAAETARKTDPGPDESESESSAFRDKWADGSVHSVSRLMTSLFVISPALQVELKILWRNCAAI